MRVNKFFADLMSWAFSVWEVVRIETSLGAKQPKSCGPKPVVMRGLLLPNPAMCK